MGKSKFWSDFKDFAMKGNVVDMAVGVVVGGAFGKIVSSLVNDILMPFIGYIIGGFDFTTLKATLTKHGLSGEASTVDIMYGNFIQQFVDFVIIALCIFLVLRALTVSKRKKEAAEAEAAAKAAAEAAAAPEVKPADVALLEEIRDLLKKQ